MKVFALENLCNESKKATTVKYLLTGKFIIFPIGLRLVNQLSWLMWGREEGSGCASSPFPVQVSGRDGS